MITFATQELNDQYAAMRLNQQTLYASLEAETDEATKVDIKNQIRQLKVSMGAFVRANR